MATQNAVDTSLAGQTGTGNFVGSTSPTIVTPLIGQINDPVHNLAVMTFTNPALAVNFIGAIGNVAGGVVGFQFGGTDANVNAVFTAKGSGGFSFGNNLGGAVDNILTLAGAITAVNGVTITSSLTTVPPIISATGADANINLSLTGKGTSGVNISGVTDGSVAPLGIVGQLQSSVIAAASAITLNTGAVNNVTALTLLDGDYDVWGNVDVTASVGMTNMSCWVSLTPTTLPDKSLYNVCATTTAIQTQTGLSTPMLSFSLGAQAIVYLSCVATFATGSVSACGGIYARRRR
jgi:hypothetical protein